MTEVASGPRVNMLARTYGPEAPVRVHEYRQVMDHTADNPGQGSGAIANALGLPRSRIRPWIESGAKPDAVRAIATADDLGWFDAAPGSDRFRALVRCHAWIFAGGSIAAGTYQPTFCVDGADPEDLLRSELETLGLESYRQRSDEPGRGTEVCPAANGVILGRFLAGCLDAPVGHKSESTPERVPHWLRRSSTTVTRTWAETYVTVRGVVRDDRDDALQLREHRSERYQETLQTVLQSAVETPEAIRRYGDSTVYVRQPAASALRM
jgi:hypothetical protein